MIFLSYKEIQVDIKYKEHWNENISVKSTLILSCGMLKSEFTEEKICTRIEKTGTIFEKTSSCFCLRINTH